MSSGHVDENPLPIKDNDDAAGREALLVRFKAALEAMRTVLDEIEATPIAAPDAVDGGDGFLAVLWALTRGGDLHAFSEIIAGIEHALEEAGL